MTSPSRSPGWSAADERLLGEVHRALGGRHELVGALGRDRHGLPALIARETTTGELAVLLLDRAADTEGGAAELTLVERRTLDETIPAPGVPCPSCRAPQQAWTHACAVCGSEVDGATYARGLDPAQLLGMVQRAVAAEMEVIGTIHHAATSGEPGAPVYIARERSTNDLVALRLAGRTTDAVGQTEITLGVVPLPALALPEAAGATSDAPRPTSRATPPPGVATVSLLREALEAAAQPAPDEARVCPQCGTEYPAGVRFCARDGAALRARNSGSDLTSQIVAEKYLVLRKLGVGGMGEVYLAKHVHMGRECALKIMRRELTDDVDAAGRFRREAASASRVNHPNIATIYDFGETSDGIAYIVMEYVDGEPLSAILAREGKLEPERAVEIARQIADALGAAHDLGIVHRDLKPDNVMIARGRGGADEVKVVDFGIAKAIQAGSRQLTRTGYVLGTPAYMSPEQILGEDLDGRSDQYNLACILYEMLTGRVTFAGPTGEIVIHRRLTEPPPHPRKVNPAVPRALDDVVARALARTAAERFANAAEFGSALAEAIERRDARWSPLAWLGRKTASEPARTASASAPGEPGSRSASTPPAAASASSTSATATGIPVPRVRPTTGAETSGGVSRIAPVPDPPTSPPLARPKWPGGGGVGGGTFDPAGTSGERVSVPAGASGAAGAREPWVGAAVTGEHTGGQSGGRELEPAAVDAAGGAPANGPASGPRRTHTVAAAAPPRAARSRVRIAVAGGVLAAVAAGVLLWVTERAPERDARSASSSGGARGVKVGGGAAGGATGDSAGAAAIGAKAGVPVAGAAGAGGAVGAGDRSGSVLAAELDAQITRQAALANEARARAVAAGAPARDLMEGDSLSKSALAWRGRGDYANALRDEIGATQSWTLAERAAEAARQSASRSPSAVAVIPAAPPARTPAAPSRGSDPTGQAHQAAPESATPAPPTTGTVTGAGANEAAAAATSTLRDYVEALSRRDLAAMRRSWPTMPASTADGFQKLFELATNFSASLTGEPAPRVNGPAADAELRYSLEYFLPAQGALKRSFRLHAVLRRDRDRWTIRSLEPVR